MLVSKLAPFLDARPGVSHGERAKAIRPVSVRLGVADAYLYGSSDWREWKPLGDRAMFRSEIYNSFDSQNHPFWSPAEGRYVCIYRIMIDDVRTMACTDSADLHRWRDPQPVRYEGAAGDGTVPPFQVYTHQTEPYFRAPHLYVALAARFMQGRRALTDEQAAAIPIPEILAGWSHSEGRTYPRPEDCSERGPAGVPRRVASLPYPVWGGVHPPRPGADQLDDPHQLSAQGNRAHRAGGDVDLRQPRLRASELVRRADDLAYRRVRIGTRSGGGRRAADETAFLRRRPAAAQLLDLGSRRAVRPRSGTPPAVPFRDSPSPTAGSSSATRSKARSAGTVAGSHSSPTAR